MFSIKVFGNFKPGRLTKPFGTASASIHSSARSSRRFPYFWSIEDGRRGVSPYAATSVTGTRKSLMWQESGEKVFRRSVGPARAQHLRRQTLVMAMPVIKAGARVWKGSLQELVNWAAEVLRVQLQRVTPKRSGKLAGSYYVRPGS